MIQYRRGVKREGEVFERGETSVIRARTQSCTYVARLQKFMQCVNTYVYVRMHTFADTHTYMRRLRAWRTKAPGKRKDVVKKTMGERAGDAARPSILHKVRWEISINRFRHELSIGASRSFRQSSVGNVKNESLWNDCVSK